MLNLSATQVAGLQGAGVAMQAIGSYYSAQAQKEELDFQARMAEINARLAEGQAQNALLAGQREEQKARLETANIKSRQRAGMAANGVDLSVGSAQNVLTSTDLVGEVDANQIQANAIASAWGYRTNAVNLTNQAGRSRSAAGAISPMGSAASSLLGNAGSVASTWYTMSKAGK